MKKTFSILFALFLMSVTMVSCGSEDEVTANFPVELLGMWEGVSVSDNDDAPVIKPGEDVGEIVTPTSGITDIRLYFDVAGVVVVLKRTAPGVDEWKETARGAWLYRTNELLLSFKANEIMTCKLSKLDYLTMKFAVTQSVTDDKEQTEKVTYNCTFQRVNIMGN